MTDKPIIFSAPMVQALLDGRKTQTRRVLKPQPAEQPPARCHPAHAPRHSAPYLDAYCGELRTPENPRGMSRLWYWWQVDDRLGPLACKAPCAPGDRLWVKENLRRAPDVWTYGADGAEVGWPARRELASRTKDYLASRFMLKVASRLTLIVTDVRVQRVAEITEDDAFAEGASRWGADSTNGGIHYSVREDFARIWNSIHGPGAWERNDWVCALTFTVHKCNIERISK